MTDLTSERPRISRRTLLLGGTAAVIASGAITNLPQVQQAVEDILPEAELVKERDALYKESHPFVIKNTEEIRENGGVNLRTSRDSESVTNILTNHLPAGTIFKGDYREGKDPENPTHHRENAWVVGRFKDSEGREFVAYVAAKLVESVEKTLN